VSGSELLFKVRREKKEQSAKRSDVALTGAVARFDEISSRNSEARERYA